MFYFQKNYKLKVLFANHIRIIFVNYLQIVCKFRVLFSTILQTLHFI